MRVAFNDLPQPVRERFIRIASTPEVPGALLKSSYGYYNWVAPVFAVLALGGSIYAFVFELNEALHKAPYHDREVYLGLAGLLFVFLVGAITTAYQLVWKNPPYRRGTYLFPSYVVIVHGADMDVIPLSDIGKPTLVSRYRNGAYMGTRLDLASQAAPSVKAEFHFSSQESAEQAASAFFAARDRMKSLLAARDSAAITQIDPFHECTISGQWTEPAGAPKLSPLVDRVPPAATWGKWLGSFGVAVAATAIFYSSMVAVCSASPEAQRHCSQDRYRKGPCCY